MRRPKIQGLEFKVKELRSLPRIPHRTQPPTTGRQEGWALLTLIFFSALLAISLMSVLPRAAMEARREKEADLIHRGHQYERAIQLYFRKFRRYPSKLEELENTNGIRFLRRRFADPITGSEEWRFIHIGPQGVLTDSLVQPPPSAVTAAVPGVTPGVPGALPGTQRRPPQPGASQPASAFGQSGSFVPQQRSGSRPASGFGQTSGFGQPSSFAGQRGQVPQRSGPQPAAFGLPGRPGQRVPSAGVAIPGLPAGVQVRRQPGQATPRTPRWGQPSGRGQPSGAGRPVQPGRPMGPGMVMIPGLPAGVQIGMPPGLQRGAPAGASARGMSPGTGLAASVGTTATGFAAIGMTPGGQPAGRGGQQFGGGGIAGVASKSKKEEPSMKVYRGREKYNEWEFVYDFRRDPTMLGQPGARPAGPTGPLRGPAPAAGRPRPAATERIRPAPAGRVRRGPARSVRPAAVGKAWPTAARRHRSASTESPASSTSLTPTA